MKLVVPVGLTLLVLAALGAGSAAGKDRIRFFQTPSRNIGCIYAPAESAGGKPYLRCDIGSGLKPLPRRPASCDLDWGYGYSMRSIGKARPFCAGDTARDPRARVLRYGSRWKHAGLTCLSRRIGLRCVNRSKHGFFLSRERSYTF